MSNGANGPGSTLGGTLELDTGYHPFVGRWNVQQLVNSGWLLLKIADVNYQLQHSPCGSQVTLCDPIKHGPCLSAIRDEVSCSISCSKPPYIYIYICTFRLLLDVAAEPDTGCNVFWSPQSYWPTDNHSQRSHRYRLAAFTPYHDRTVDSSYEEFDWAPARKC